MLHPVKHIASLVVKVCIVRVAGNLIGDRSDLRVFKCRVVSDLCCGIALLAGQRKQQCGYEKKGPGPHEFHYANLRNNTDRSGGKVLINTDIGVTHIEFYLLLNKWLTSN